MNVVPPGQNNKKEAAPFKVEAPQSITEQQVEKYLLDNPAFFTRNEYLLEKLKLPHPSGNAISLVQKQVQVFREQRDELKEEFHQLLEIARQNERLFEKSKRLLLGMLEAKSLDEMLIVIDESIRGDFGMDHCGLILFGDKSDYPTTQVNMLRLDDAIEQLGALMETPKAFCGHISGKRLDCLFPQVDTPVDKQVKSVAVIPLNYQQPLGMFSLGSADPDYFDSSMGSMFLSYISDSLSRMLPPMLMREKTVRGFDELSASDQ
jgi:uncharacterized protein YigA (DUF484 family)